MPDTSSPAQYSPETLQKLFEEACLLHQKGELYQAIRRYQELLELMPQSSLLHFNCGLAMFNSDNYLEAEYHYALACTFCPDDPDMHYNRGLNFRRLGQIEDAVNSFEKTMQTGDRSMDTLYNLALSYQDDSRHAQAALLYDSILQSNPEHISTLNNYAFLCHKTGDKEKAKTLYGRLLSIDPSHKAARHMLHSLSGNTPDTAPLEYVETIFDNYAKNFEENLVNKLSYKTPALLRQRYHVLFPNDRRDVCLDIGCGTGLAGMEFANCCKELTGIDISAEMLAVAGEKGIYKTLVKTDLTAYLTETDMKVDIMIAADVLTYIGNLEPLFQLSFAKTQPGGLFLFSVEDSAKEANFALKETGRFGHSPQYIQELCQQTGWVIRDQHFVKLRKEKNKWISGYLYILQK